MYLRQVYFCASDRVISLTQTGLFACLRHGYFCVLARFISVPAMIISVSQPDLFQGYLCVETGVSL